MDLQALTDAVKTLNAAVADSKTDVSWFRRLVACHAAGFELRWMGRQRGERGTCRYWVVWSLTRQQEITRILKKLRSDFTPTEELLRVSRSGRADEAGGWVWSGGLVWQSLSGDVAAG
jgi:hypothetical protein